MGGRKLNITIAVSRDKARELEELKKKKVDKIDYRNLHLIRESCKYFSRGNFIFLY